MCQIIKIFLFYILVLPELASCGVELEDFRHLVDQLQQQSQQQQQQVQQQQQQLQQHKVQLLKQQQQYELQVREQQQQHEGQLREQQQHDVKHHQYELHLRQQHQELRKGNKIESKRIHGFAKRIQFLQISYPNNPYYPASL